MPATTSSFFSDSNVFGGGRADGWEVGFVDGERLEDRRVTVQELVDIDVWFIMRGGNRGVEGGRRRVFFGRWRWGG